MKPLKVLHVTNNDVLGGASRYVMRLHESLCSAGVDSKIIVLSKTSDNDQVINSKGNRYIKKISHLIDRIVVSLFYKQRSKFSTGVYGGISIEQLNNFDTDLIHIHWINDGTLSIKSLRKIKAPIVWSVVDMWPFTGGCHYDGLCNGYTNSCGNCPELHSSRKKDLSSLLLELKKDTYQKTNLSLVAISTWIKDCIIDSYAMKGLCVDLVYPCINTVLFRPLNKSFSRDMFLLPKNKKLILFGAMNSTSDSRKGYKALIRSLKLINKENYNDIEIVIFGATSGEIDQDVDFKMHFVGRLTSGYGIHDDGSLAALFSAADVTVVPSLQEAFGQVAIESMACGTPVVAFRDTGLEDIVTHKKDGYLAINNNAKDFSEGIQWALSNPCYSDIITEKIERTFGYKVIAEQMIDIYKKRL